MLVPKVISPAAFFSRGAHDQIGELIVSVDAVEIRLDGRLDE
jgi:hypothetical protein